MANKRVKIGGEELPSMLTTSVLLKAFGDKDLKAMWEKYKENKVQKSLTEPTALQYKLAEARKRGDSPRKIVSDFKKEKVSATQVSGALQRVAIWEYIKK